MTIEQAAIFMAATVLLGMGITTIGITVLVLNNLFSKYWQPITLRVFTYIDSAGKPVTAPK